MILFVIISNYNCVNDFIYVDSCFIFRFFYLYEDVIKISFDKGFIFGVFSCFIVLDF